MAKIKMHHLFLIEGWYTQDYFSIHVTGWFSPSLQDDLLIAYRTYIWQYIAKVYIRWIGGYFYLVYIRCFFYLSLAPWNWSPHKHQQAGQANVANTEMDHQFHHSNTHLSCHVADILHGHRYLWSPLADPSCSLSLWNSAWMTSTIMASSGSCSGMSTCKEPCLMSSWFNACCSM